MSTAAGWRLPLINREMMMSRTCAPRYSTALGLAPAALLLTALGVAGQGMAAEAGAEAAAVEAEDKAPGKLDVRVRKALEAEQLEFEVDPKGDAKIILRFTDDGDRTQLVIVQSATFSYRQTEFREVFSAGLKADDEKGLDLALARRLMEESSRSKLAFWGIEDGVVWAIARIPADASPGSLREAVDFVAVRADDLEKERLGTDEF
jgi:hypothetical protein